MIEFRGGHKLLVVFPFKLNKEDSCKITQVYLEADWMLDYQTPPFDHQSNISSQERLEIIAFVS